MRMIAGYCHRRAPSAEHSIFPMGDKRAEKYIEKKRRERERRKNIENFIQKREREIEIRRDWKKKRNDEESE